MALRYGFATLAAVAALACMPAAALAQEPPDIVAPGSNWISGDLLSQTGLNCSTAIIGNAYTEIMVSGVAAYGGAPGGGVPNVGEPYWTSFLVSIPGNPCGSGSSNVVTTLILPPSTQIDTGRQIRCFGLPRSQSAWTELTGGSWSFLGSSGPYCPGQASGSPYHLGGNQIGYRPLANGQLFWLFVPVKSSAPLIGAAGPSPGHGFTWMTDATGVYANPGRSFVWANVFNDGGGTPFIYFGRNPTVLPFWKADAPDLPGSPPMPTKSRAEWFANLYSGFHQGNLCWELWYGSPGTGTLATDCTNPSAGWNSFVPSSADSFFVVGTGTAEGPNGGYVPFSYDDDPPGTNFTIRWKFTYNDGTQKTVTKDAPFRTLNGPDVDGDGVGANEDSCPSAKGTLANGCLPGAQADPDQDGVYGATDLCPSTAGNGALNGCPGGIVPEIKPPDPPKTLVATLLTKKNALFKKKALARGAPVKFECTVDSAAKGTLSITSRVAKKLKIKTKKKQKRVTIASGKGRCVAGSGGTLKLKLAKAYAGKVKRARKGFPASLAVDLTAPGQTAVTIKRGVKVG